MKKEKHNEVLQEVLDEIEAAQRDKRGLIAHQRRLAFALSLGAVNLLELYFHNLNVIKEGSKINHMWFKKKEESIRERLQNQITSPLNTIKQVNIAIRIISSIEKRRDDLAYGPSATEEELQKKINEFFELRRLLK